MTGILAGLIGSFKKAALSWTTGTTTTQVFYAAAYANLTNGKYFAFGQSSTGTNTQSYQYSTNGTSWTTGTLPSNASWRAAAASPTRIIALRTSATSGYLSDDGTTWYLTGSFPSTISPQELIWDGTRFIATSGTNANVYYGTNGTSWAAAATGISGNTASIGFDGISRHIVTNQTGGTNAVTTTSFPTGWSAITMPASGTWISAVYGNNIWVAARAGSAIYGTSTNGTTWTSRTLPSNFSESTSDVYAKMTFTDGQFYYYYVDNVYSSTDGINWTTEATITGGNLDNGNGWAVGGSKALCFGYNGTNTGSATYLIGQ